MLQNYIYRERLKIQNKNNIINITSLAYLWLENKKI